MRANYNSYKNAYRKKQNILTAKGLTMYDSMLTKSEFEAVYEATRNQLKDEVAKGKRKVIGNVTQTIVTNQSYEYSQKQGKALAEYAKETGQKLTQSQIRAGLIDWAPLEARQAELRAIGIKGKDLRDQIGQEFFGSD